MTKNIRFRWRNYKGFKDTDWLEIKPITLLLGSNGSGKSSVIQPLLLLAQTLESADTSMSLMASGEYIKAGSFQDLVHNHNIDLPVSFEFDFTSPEQKTKKKKKLGAYPPSKSALQFRSDCNKMPLLHSIKLTDYLDRQMLYRELNNNKYTLSYLSKLQEQDSLSQEIEYQQPTHFLFSEEDVIRKALEVAHIQRPNENTKTNISFSEQASEYLAEISYFNNKIKRLLTSVKYIGPIREYPKRYYEYSGEYHPQVGLRGEYTFSMLFQLLKNEPRRQALYKWLHNFGLTDEVHCELLQNRPDLLEIYVKTTNSDLKINYADTCFGISQILPLLVQSIMAENDDIVITEQPEIHLNPNCETTLADFFVDMVSTKKVNYIIETHSEHYLLRLRKHIKTGLIKAEDVAIYMTEKINGESFIKRLEIDNNGNFPNKDWPKGFFEQALSESLMFATAKKVPNAD